MFKLDKFSLIILTRCNLKCKLCCEYVPQNKPFPDMTLEEECKILDAFFNVVDHVRTLHLTGGGEPFLHPKLAEMVEFAMEYSDKFDRLMLFTNSTVPIVPKLMDVLVRFKDKILVQVSHYGIFPEREQETLQSLLANGITCKTVKYYGEEQDFGGWVDFGGWSEQARSGEELEARFSACAVTKMMSGNWRTRDGKVHWCSRSQRGMELGLMPDAPEDYVDLLDQSTVEEKREKFKKIESSRYLTACKHCSGDQGTDDADKRYPAAQQMEH